MWGDLAATKVDEESPDEGFESIIQLVPEERREMAQSMVRGFLANVKAQLSPENYRIYCTHLKAAWEAHKRGDKDTARTILANYGLPYDVLAENLG